MRYGLSLGLALSFVLAAGCGSSGAGGGFTGAGGTAASGGISKGGTGNTSASGGSGNTSASGGTGNVGATGGSGNASGTGGDGGPGACTSNADCAGNPKGSTCDTATGNCVGCVGTGDCPQGQYCDTAKQACAAGCNADSDCAAPTPHCDTTNHQCRECLNDTDCPGGKICVAGSCSDGCSANQPCPNAAETCCGASCHDLTSDVNDCGACGTACPPVANATMTCANGACSMGACAAGFADCDQNSADGCEWNTGLGGPCACTPNATQDCYTGPSGTQGVGACKAGTQTCDASGTFWGPCLNQIVPAPEVCANNIDEDCNGVADDVADIDGDGWTACNGDCCETTADCSKPTKVNPGAFEVVGNGVDDDCDATTSDATAPANCSTAQKFAAVSATDVAKAMDICQFTTANPPLPQKKWGVITATQLRADGTVPSATELSDMQNSQTAVLVNYGTGGVLPTKGPTIAGISSGRMRDEGDTGYVNPNGGSAFTNATSPPPAYLAAHGGALPSSAGCSGTCPSGSGANDAVNIRLTIRVPTNALSFSYKFRFFSAEYWTYQCTVFNDFYLALLQTGAPGIPADKNISFDSKNNPVSVNNGFFEICATKTCNTCPFGTGPLAGTGMEVGGTGGGTNWLTTTAPVVPGETMQIEFMVFDVSDHILDSLTLLDNFQWSLDPSGVGTTG